MFVIEIILKGEILTRTQRQSPRSKSPRNCISKKETTKKRISDVLVA